MIAAVEEGVRPATRQHGCVVVARVGEQIVVPTDARAYAVLTWIYVHEDGNVIFREGEYDLTREKALARFANRSKLTEKALASNFASVLGS
jgi:hypothetical protein